MKTFQSRSISIVEKNALDNFRATSDSLAKFLHEAGRLICSREHNGVSVRGWVHHNGAISKFLRSETGCSHAELSRYFDDTEHGLFHGLMTAFPVWHLSGGKQCSPRMIATCVLHDFCRAALGIEDGHDAALRDVFPRIGPAAYWHTNPRNADAPLVNGDRWELLRFADWADWVNRRELPGYPDPVLTTFYRFIRPALERFREGRDRLWIGHGPERVGAVRMDEECYPSSHLTDDIYEDLSADPNKVCAKVFSFLGIARSRR